MTRRKRLCPFFLLVAGAFCTAAAQTDAERKLCLQAFGYGADVAALATEAVSTGAEAVWGASEANGGVVTLTGTLTQSTQNADQWTYSAVPNDRLVIVFAGGPTVQFAFAAFAGYLSGTWEDFIYSHSIDFTCLIQGRCNLRIQSQATPVADSIRVSRVITGTCTYYGEQVTTNITYTGRVWYELGSGFAFYTYKEWLAGTASSASGLTTVNERIFISIAHNSNTAVHARNDERWNTSSASLNGVTYRYENVHASWARRSTLSDPGAFNVVTDANYWVAEGQMLRNGAVWGAVKFDGEVVEGSTGPDIILDIGGGASIFVYRCIGADPTSVHEEAALPVRYELRQNYPNPFNPTTTIEYTLPASGRVTLRVFNLLGQPVATLADGMHTAGGHSVRFNASNLPSGVYVYRLESGSYAAARKMVLTK